jgi:hypothetical protein
VAVDAREKQHAAGGHREGGRHGDAQSSVGDEVTSEMRSQAGDGGHGQEREAGLQGAGAEDFLQVHRGQQKRPEQHSRRGQHHQEAATDGALTEPGDVEQRRARPQLERSERTQAGQP